MGDNMLLDEYLEYLNDGWTPFSPDVLGPTGQAAMNIATGPVGTAAPIVAGGLIAGKMLHTQLKKNKCAAFKNDPEKYRQCMKGRR